MHKLRGMCIYFSTECSLEMKCDKFVMVFNATALVSVGSKCFHLQDSKLVNIFHSSKIGNNFCDKRHQKIEV